MTGHIFHLTALATVTSYWREAFVVASTSYHARELAFSFQLEGTDLPDRNVWLSSQTSHCSLPYELIGESPNGLFMLRRRPGETLLFLKDVP